MKTIQPLLRPLGNRRLIFPALTFVIGFIAAALLVTSSPVNAQSGCPTATPTATPGGVLAFSGTGDTSVASPITLKDGIYSFSVEVISAKTDPGVVSVNAVALDATQATCADKNYIYMETLSAGQVKPQTVRYKSPKGTDCEFLLNISASTGTVWKLTITPIKT